MKHLYRFCFVLALLLTTSIPVNAQSYQPVEQPRLITVRGEADLSVAPDKALVTIRIESRQDRLDKAKAHVDSVSTALLNLTDDMGIDRKDVHTAYYSIQPMNAKRSKHVVQTQVVVTVKNLDRVGELVERATGIGVDEIADVSFELADPLASRLEVHRLAVDAARRKAEIMASTAGAALGRVYRITELMQSPWEAKSTNVSNLLSMAAGIAVEEYGYDEQPFSVGQLTMTGSVEVAFELE